MPWSSGPERSNGPGGWTPTTTEPSGTAGVARRADAAGDGQPLRRHGRPARHLESGAVSSHGVHGHRWPPPSGDHPPAGGAAIPNGSSVTVTGTAADVGGSGGRRRGLARRREHLAPGDRPRQLDLHRQCAGLRLRGIKSRAADDSGNIQTAPTSVTVNVRAPAPSSPRPTHPKWSRRNADTAGIELGAKFTSDVDGWVTGVRFYKGAANTGTHTGSLWTASRRPAGSGDIHRRVGQRLAAGELLDAGRDPAGHHLRRVVLRPNGGYSSTRNYFATARTAVPLRGLPDGDQGPNGVFRYSIPAPSPPPGSRARTTGWTPCSATIGPPDSTPPTVIATNPVSNQTDGGPVPQGSRPPSRSRFNRRRSPGP